MTRTEWLLPALLLASCGTAGNAWIADSPNAGDTAPPGEFTPPSETARSTGYEPMETLSIGRQKPKKRTPEALAVRVAVAESGGKSLGTYRNTYYDFPAETEFDGATVGLFNAQCTKIADVAKAFHDTLCVQGSGHLKDGSTVSFARRNCSCAAVCPTTSSQICYDQLDKADYPWGRGASGKPIVPLLTLAADSDVLPLGTAVYIPEYDGLPRDFQGQSMHDGCFIVQDRGSKVKGQHVDVFTGETAMTKLWNSLVPSNGGVHVISGAPRCARF